LKTAEAHGHSLRCVRPLMVNSDHANFALAGIPAFRLVAGFDDPASNLRLVLTSADTRDKVAQAELAAAADFAAALVCEACKASQAEAQEWRS
uniref:hypothetical protein n=1 Tax=Microvirga massiliensis TaxID=1033741 RepID=UPI000B2A5B9F